MITLWLATGVIGAGDGTAVVISGDGASIRGTRPIVTVKPRPEEQLEDVLELVEEITPANRTSIKRKAVKDAREAFRAVEVPPDYSGASQAILAALSKASRAAGEYQAFQDAIEQVAQQIEAMRAEIAAAEQRRRLKRRREEEMLVWLWHSRGNM